jgi:hypothetical protein
LQIAAQQETVRQTALKVAAQEEANRQEALKLAAMTEAARQEYLKQQAIEQARLDAIVAATTIAQKNAVIVDTSQKLVVQTNIAQAQTARALADEVVIKQQAAAAAALIEANRIKQLGYDESVVGAVAILRATPGMEVTAQTRRNVTARYMNGTEVINTYYLYVDDAGNMGWTGDTPRAFWMEKRTQYRVTNVWNPGYYNYWYGNGWNNGYGWGGWGWAGPSYYWGWYHNGYYTQVNTYNLFADAEKASVAKWNSLSNQLIAYAKGRGQTITGMVTGI